MIKKLLTLFLISTCLLGFSQTFEWVKTPAAVISGNPSSMGYSTTVDPFGNVYMAGYQDTPTFYTELFGNLFYHKYDSSGVLLFTKTFSGTAVLHQMTTDSAGNILLAVEYLNVLVVDGVTIPNTTQLSQHVFLKLSPLGVLLWHKVLGMSEFNVSTFKSIAVDATDTIYLGYDTYVDCRIEKISPTGTLLSTISQLNVNRLTSLDVDADGNIYAAGTCANINSTYAGVAQPTSFDYSVYLVKYSSAGVFQWIKYIEDITCDAPMVQVHSPNDIYLCAPTFLAVTLGSITLEGPTGGGEDFFLAKLNASGMYLWAREVPGNGSFAVGNKHYLSLDSLGNVYLAGTLSGGLTTWGSGITTNTTPFGNREAALLKYDTSGLIQMAVTAGGMNNDASHSVVVGSNGSIYWTGLVQGSATFGTLTHTNSDPFGYAPFMAKIQNGTLSVPDNPLQVAKVFPNPVRDLLTIETSQQVLSASVYAMNGQYIPLVRQGNQVDFSPLAKGVYVVRVETEKGIEWVKVMR